MSWQTDQLRYSLGMGTLVTFYGFVSIVIFVAGDRFGLDLNYKIVVIAIVLLTLPFALVIGLFATRKKKVKPEDAAAEGSDAAQTEENQAAAPPRTTTPNGKYAELNESADVAFKFLQSSNLAGTTGKEAIYALPFFLFAGTPRSGKTSLVQSSNLDFQVLPNQRQSEQNFIRPTKSVDWRVTNDAVLLDTAGRYQLEGIDGEEFSAFIEILKKQRGNRPLDGFVLTVNAAKLVGADDAEIEQQAKTLRARLDETMQRTKIKFPVYLVFTNADSIEGFRDSFSISQQEGKNLIVGTTFPLEKCEIAHSLFDSEFEELQSSFIKRRLLRLSAPFPPARQLRIFNFPAHFSSSRRKFGQFVATLFRPNPFNENPMFRGFYFTAAIPQVQQERGASENAATVKTIAASYFAERFFQDVLLRDKNLVATFQAQKVRQPILGWLMVIIGTFLTMGLLAMSIVSTYYNKQMLEDASAKAEEVLLINTADKGRNVLTKNSTEARNEIEAMDKLRQVTAKLDEYERGAPIYMRFGMYSGDRILHERLLPIYFAAVEQRYKEPVRKRLEENLRAFAANQNALNSANLTDDQEKELGKNYDLLKAYLMLSGDYSKYAEPIFVQKQLKDLWKKSAPSELEALSDEQLAFYSSQINREEFPRIPLDKSLVDASRKRLQAYPAVFRYYKRITTETDKKIEPVSVESVLAGRSAGQLEGSEKVPGSYTMEGYRGEMQKAILNAQTELSKEDWVMGEQANDPNNAAITNDEIAKLQERYFNDYTDNWRRFVRGIRVTKTTNKTEVTNSLKSFSATESPMEIVLREIAVNTNFSAKPKTNDWYSWFASFFQKTDTSKAATSNEVEREFKPLFVFMGDETKPDSAPIALYRADLRKLVEPIEGASNDQLKQITQDLAVNNDSIGLRRTEASINGRLENFTTSAAQEIAQLLKRPAQNVRAFFGADRNTQLDKAWREQILPKATEIQNGYPFNDSGEADLPKLTAFLNPTNGTLTTFYNERLSSYFEEANGQIKPKDGIEVKFNDDFIAYLNNAFKLRDAMFGKNATPNFEYELKLQPSKDAIFEVQIDGQKIDSSGTSSTKFSFPAKSGVETGAILQLSSTADSVSTSNVNKNANVAPAITPTPSANSNLSNINALPTPTPTPTATPKPAKVAPTPVPVQPLKFSGQWGLFKMVDAGTPSKSANGDYALSYKFGGKSVVAIVKPTGGDLFDKSLFRNVKAPSNILK
ncbi:MAG: type VI secretion system membrane subunit TssM [Pyrinomonadaceae bacterium]|nr:type VI secretion system membrane subunit TssM [Pyrinomonadaceae bacterium]